MTETCQGLVDYAAFLVDLRRRGVAPKKPAVELPRPSKRLPGVSPARHALEEGGQEGFARWLRACTRLLFSDVTIERLQSQLLGGRIRTADLAALAGQAVRLAPELCALEVLSGNMVGRALAEAHECPFRRVEEIRKAAPGVPLRASVSAATAWGGHVIGQKQQIEALIEVSRSGIDIIRVADPFNDADRLAAAVDAVASCGVVVEGAVCVSGALHPTKCPNSFVDAAVAVATTLERHGVHAVVIEDHLGVMRPVAAYRMVRAISREVRVPVWVRFVESSGAALASSVAAAEAGAVGVDVVSPAVRGVGFECDSVALSLALSDTERKPEVETLRLHELDEHFEGIVSLLGGTRNDRRPPPDTGDRGVAPAVLAQVMDHPELGDKVTVDHALTACENAWNALGEPAAVPPAENALVELSRALLLDSEPAGQILDRARADDPQGSLDSVASLREGGFSELIDGAEPVAQSRSELLSRLWSEQHSDYEDHIKLYGEIEMLRSAQCLYGLAPGESIEATINGEHHELRVVEGSPGSRKAAIELDGEPVQPSSSSKRAE